MGFFPFKYACLADLIYSYVPGHGNRIVFPDGQAADSQCKLAGCYATAFSRNLTHCRYPDCPGICQSAECRGIPTSRRFSDHSAYSAYNRTVYRRPINECLDSSRTRCSLRNTRLDPFTKIYGAVHIRKAFAIEKSSVQRCIEPSFYSTCSIKSSSTPAADRQRVLSRPKVGSLPFLFSTQSRYCWVSDKFFYMDSSVYYLFI